MIKFIFYMVLIGIGHSSCKSVQNSKSSIVGTYISVGNDYKYTLELNSNNSFMIEMQDLDITTSCTGKWEWHSNHTVLLKCDEDESQFSQLSSGYMKDRERKFKIVNNKTLKLGEVKFKRI